MILNVSFHPAVHMEGPRCVMQGQNRPQLTSRTKTSYKSSLFINDRHINKYLNISGSSEFFTEILSIFLFYILWFRSSWCIMIQWRSAASSPLTRPPSKMRYVARILKSFLKSMSISFQDAVKLWTVKTTESKQSRRHYLFWQFELIYNNKL